ncbi:MAG TPA: hypothetical protein VGR02_22800 [Thermoanaerobaculia bacterium]|nr:hypothetical protein [Thermoanaerobaculia bacterium]
MNKPLRLGFLPIFFICLGTAFAAAVFVRIHNYSADDARLNDGTTRTASAPVDGTSSQAQANTGTITELDPGALGTLPPPELESTPEAMVAARALREQRYQQLLNASAQPAAKTVSGLGRPGVERPTIGPQEDENLATTKTASKESAVSRLIRPITNLLGGNGSSPSSSSSTPPKTTTGASHDDTKSNTQDPQKEKDLSSDTTPPQVLSIQFTPAQVRDGEETLLAVNAMDDLSGVRTISGSIVSPSGGLQGFALQREGETARYVSRVVIPKDSPEGIWRINYLNLADNASNTLALTFHGTGAPALANAMFRVVSSQPDATGPTLRTIWLDKPAMRAGEKNTISVQAQDDKSGVNMVSGVFQSPSHFARIGFGCRLTAGDALNGTWQCEISTPACVDCGDWQLEQVQMQDKANNMTTVRIDNPAVAGVRLSIGGDSCDSQPPALQTAALDRDNVSNVEVSTITMTVTVADDACGVASVSGQAAGPPTEGGQPPRIYFSFTASGDPTTWVAKITVPKLAAKGLWNVAWMQILDKGNNLKTYSHADPQLANAVFRVQ